MSDIKAKVQNLNPNIQSRDVSRLSGTTGNIYETLNVIQKRANQLSVELKMELHSKLEEFATSTEAIEEISENKEQIEISKFYEKLPNPVIIATNEYLSGQLEYRFLDEEDDNL